MAEDTDLSFKDHGTVVLIQMNTAAGLEWVERNLNAEGWQWLGVFMAVDPRQVEAIVDGASNDGLTVGL